MPGRLGAGFFVCGISCRIEDRSKAVGKAILLLRARETFRAERHTEPAQGAALTAWARCGEFETPQIGAISGIRVTMFGANSSAVAVVL